MLIDSSTRQRRAFFGITVAVILAIYSYPSIRTALATGSTALPAVTAPDLGLYVTLGKLETLRDGSVLNPYYRISVPSKSVGFLTFRAGPILYGLLTKLLGGRMWLALILWNVFWWGLLCLAALWLSERFLPSLPCELVLAGLSVLMLFNFATSTQVLRAWTHFSSSSVLVVMGLPYLRPFTPQVAIPLLLFYLGLQIRAVKGSSLAAWAGMALLQFLAFITYPYAMLMMAATTAVVAVWYIVARSRHVGWRIVFGYALVCGLLDVAFLRHGAAGFRTGFPDQASLIHLQLSLVSKSIGKLWILTAILTVLALASPKLIPEVKWTLGGLGLANLLLVLGDAVVPERTLALSEHCSYFYQPTIAILTTFLVSTSALAHRRASQVLRILSAAAVALCFVNGFFSAEAAYRNYLPYNVAQRDIANWFARGQAKPNDLIISEFSTSQYNICEWIPLLSDAEVLYCRNSQCLLTPEQNAVVQRRREVMYLYFTGKDRDWLQKTADLESYGFYGELSAFHSPEERAARLVDVRQEMLPLFDELERGDPAIRKFLSRFRQVWVVEDSRRSVFAVSRLQTYLHTEGQEKAGSLLITTATPK